MPFSTLDTAHYHNHRPCWGFTCAPSYVPLLTEKDKQQMEEAVKELEASGELDELLEKYEKDHSEEPNA